MVNYRYVGRFGSGTLIRTFTPPPTPSTNPSDGLIAEDGITFLVAEDGATFLVQE